MTRSSRKRGTIYIFVLVSSMIVTMIGLMGFKMIRAQAAVAQADTQRDEAAVLAESAVQWGIHLVMLKEGWRDVVGSGVPIRTITFGSGQFTTTIIDDDGDLADDESDGFRIIGTGIVGSASQTYEVTISQPVGGAHPAIDRSLSVGGTLRVAEGTMSLENGGEVGTLNAHASTSGTGNITEVSPVDQPGNSLIDTWAAVGTGIRQNVHKGTIDSATFSDSSAPYGITPNTDGIYVIDAADSLLTLTNCRIQGTLVILNAAAGSVEITDCQFSFGDHGGPTLIVDGNAQIDAGFDIGVHQGLIYIDGDLKMIDRFMLMGSLMVTGNMTMSHDFMSVNAHPSATNGPPDGFTSSTTLEVLDGSWRRVVN